MAEYTPGTYSVQILGGAVQTSESGKDYVNIEFQPQYFLMQSEWQHCEGKARTMKLFLSPAAMKYTMAKLPRLGFNGDFGDGMKFTTEGVVLECIHERRDGKVWEDWTLPRERVPAKKASQKTIMDLNAQWKARHGLTPAPTNPPTPREEPAAAPPPADPTRQETSDIKGDDIPF